MPGTFYVEDPPVSRNDVLRDGDNTYTIREQLGLGNYSSVWLAKTESSTQQPGHFRLVAVKILNHNASTSDGLEFALARKQIHLELSGEETGEVAKKLLLPESTFAFNDSKGSLRHAFSFGDLYGLTVFEYAKGCPNRRMEWAAAKRCALDTISGLAFLHQNGIGHGDLHARNLLLVLNPPLATWTEKEVLEYFDKKPTRIPAPRIEAKHIQPMMEFHQSQKISFDGRIVMADFGSAYQASNSERTWAPTRFVSTAPEKLLGQRPDLPGDIWSLGCTIVEVLTGKELWCAKEPEPAPESPDDRNVVERIISKIQAALEMQPEKEFEFLEDKRLLSDLVEELWPADPTRAERGWLEALLKRIFKYEPSDRVAIREVEAMICERTWNFGTL